jgi:hypothetical protein
MFQSFFVGGGKAVCCSLLTSILRVVLFFLNAFAAQAMVVNVNPYETSLEETSHVMKFASVAKEILTARSAPRPQQAPTPRPPTPSREQKPVLTARIEKRQPLVPRTAVENFADVDDVDDGGEIVILGKLRKRGGFGSVVLSLTISRFFLRRGGGRRRGRRGRG